MGNRLKIDLKSRKGDRADKGKPAVDQEAVLAPVNFGDVKFRPGMEQDLLAGLNTREVKLDVMENQIRLDECEIHVSRPGQAGQFASVIRFFLSGDLSELDLVLIMVPGHVLGNIGSGQVIRLGTSPSGSSARVPVRADAKSGRYPLAIYGLRSDGSFIIEQCGKPPLKSAEPGRGNASMTALVALSGSTATMIVE